MLQGFVITVESPLSCGVMDKMKVGEEDAHYDDTTPKNYIFIRTWKYLELFTIV